MELERGECIFCSNKKVISQSERIHKTIKILFNNSYINEDQLEYVEPELCPVCYHKLILLEEIHKDISEKGDSTTRNSCKLCGSREEVLLVPKWNVFDKIISDFPALTSGKNNSICSACFFYLDTRNFMKEKLGSVYPKLKVSQISSSKFGSAQSDNPTQTLERKMTRPKRSLKSPLKFQTDLTTHSTPIPERRKTRTRAVREAATVIDLTEQDSPSTPPLSFRTLRQRQDDEMELPSMVLPDSKFMDQILLVKLNTSNKLSDMATNMKNKEKPWKRIIFSNEVSSEESNTTRSSRNQRMREECIEKETEVEQIRKNAFKSLKARRREKEDACIIQEDKSTRRQVKEIEPIEVDESGEESEDYSKKSKLTKRKLEPTKKTLLEHSEKSLIDFKMTKLEVNIERMQMPEESNSIESEEFFDLRLESDEVTDEKEKNETENGKMETEDVPGCNTEDHKIPEKTNGHFTGKYSKENEDGIEDKSTEAENPSESENEKSDLEAGNDGTDGNDKENKTNGIQTEEDTSAEAESDPSGSENEKSDLEAENKGAEGEEKENETAAIQTEEDEGKENSETENIAEFNEHISREDLENEESDKESEEEPEETETDTEQETVGATNEQNGDATEEVSDKNDKNMSDGETKHQENAHKHLELDREKFAAQDVVNGDSESTKDENDDQSKTNRGLELARDHDELIRELESDQEEDDAPDNVNKDSESTQDETDDHMNKDLKSTQEGTEDHEEPIIDLESSSNDPGNRSNGENGEKETSLADTNTELENTKNQFDDIENVLASFETDSDEVLDSTADSNNSENGLKRKRSDSKSDASDIPKKRRKLYTMDN